METFVKGYVIWIFGQISFIRTFQPEVLEHEFTVETKRNQIINHKLSE